MQQMKILIADADLKSWHQLTDMISNARSDARVRFAETGRQLLKLCNCSGGWLQAV